MAADWRWRAVGLWPAADEVHDGFFVVDADGDGGFSLLELLYPASYDLDIIQTEKDESRTSELRLRNARERLENLYPDSHTLDVILNKSTFTVSLILKTTKA